MAKIRMLKTDIKHVTMLQWLEFKFENNIIIFYPLYNTESQRLLFRRRRCIMFAKQDEHNNDYCVIIGVGSYLNDIVFKNSITVLPEYIVNLLIKLVDK